MEEVIKILQSITDDKGLIIKDTFTWCSAISNGVISFIGIILGAKIGFSQYKKQQSMEIKKELKIKFYNEYEDKFIDIIQKLEDCIEIVDYININYSLDMYDEDDYMIYSVDDIENSLTLDRIREGGIKSRILRMEFYKLKFFMELKKGVSGIEEFIYEDEFKEISKLEHMFQKLFNIGKISESLKKREKEGKGIKNQLENYNNGLNKIVKYGKDEKLDEIKDVMIKKHGELINKI